MNESRECFVLLVTVRGMKEIAVKVVRAMMMVMQVVNVVMKVMVRIVWWFTGRRW